ncbi:MAG: hypothetical protein GX585_05515, partial [Clostridiales bacterium]|nr:hypothetical protein [Clostridiales bacterium]
MSASREKKQRQENQGLTEKQRAELAQAQKAKSRRTLYTALGAVVVVLIAALLIWYSGFFQSRTIAATINDTEYSVADVSYYYYSVHNSTLNMASQYAQFGIDTGYNLNLSPAEQFYDEGLGKTYEDYFKETGLETLNWVALMCAEAEKAGYALSDEGRAEVDSTYEQVAGYSRQQGYSEAAYLKLLFGPYMTKSVFMEHLTMSVLANEYSDYYVSQLSYPDEELETYYEEHRDTLDSYEFRYCFITAVPEVDTDEDGHELEPTDEQLEAAMDAAEESANAMVARLETGEPFNQTAAEYVSDASAAAYADDPEYNHITDKMGSEFSSVTYGAWLADGARVAGEYGVVPSGTSGCYVVQFLRRGRAEDSHQTVDTRQILLTVEAEAPAVDTEENGETEAAPPTQAQLDTIYEKAEALLGE